MKNLLFLAILLTLVACQSAVESGPTTTVLSGKIIDQNGDKLYISMGDFKQEIEVNEDGTFSAEMIGLEEGNYFLHDMKEGTDVYILPGKDLHLTVDTKEFDESLVYTGAGAAPSNYFVQKMLRDQENKDKKNALLAKDEATYGAHIDKIKKDKINFLKSTKGLPKNFVAEQSKIINYEYIVDILEFYRFHRPYPANDAKKPSAEFMKPLEAVSLDDEKEFENNTAYNQLVQYALGVGSIPERLARLKGLKSDKIRERGLYNLKRIIQPTSETLKADYEILMATVEDEKFKKEITEKYELSRKLTKGNPSPLFNFEDRHGKMVKLEDLKGKNIYIDVWATWCGPCIAEIPDLKKLEAAYKDKNLTFVSISIDKMKDKELWLKMLEEEDLSGHQLLADNAGESNFIKSYGMNTIPRFVLLDAEGKIVSADAPRPSSGAKVRSMIDGLGI